MVEPMRNFVSLTTLLLLIFPSVVCAHDGAPPHPIVERLGGDWERDATLSEHLGRDSFVLNDSDGFSILSQHSIHDWERSFSDADSDTTIIHAGAMRFTPKVRIMYALRANGSEYEFGVIQKTIQWRPFHLVRGEDASADLLFVGTTAFRRSQTKADEP